MEVELAKFNYKSYFKQLKDEYKIPINPSIWDDEVSSVIGGIQKVWIALDGSNIEQSLIRTEIEVLGLRISMGAHTDGIYALQAERFVINDKLFSGYCPRLQGVWFATKTSEEQYCGYDYYPIFFDKEFARLCSADSYSRTAIRQWCRIKTTSV